MVKVLIVSHGHLAEELLAAARRISRETNGISALCLGWDDPPEVHSQRLAAVVAGLDREDELLILTDMYGGTPHNVAAQIAEPNRVHVLAGVNLPMVVRLTCRDDTPMSGAELARWIQQKGRAAICRCRQARTPKAGSCEEPVRG